MKIKDLIAKLQELNGDAEIYIKDEDGDYDKDICINSEFLIDFKAAQYSRRANADDHKNRSEDIFIGHYLY